MIKRYKFWVLFISIAVIVLGYVVYQFSALASKRDKNQRFIYSFTKEDSLLVDETILKSLTDHFAVVGDENYFSHLTLSNDATISIARLSKGKNINFDKLKLIESPEKSIDVLSDNAYSTIKIFRAIYYNSLERKNQIFKVIEIEGDNYEVIKRNSDTLYLKGRMNFINLRNNIKGVGCGFEFKTERIKHCEILLLNKGNNSFMILFVSGKEEQMDLLNLLNN
jgi:hypothetical protein